MSENSITLAHIIISMISGGLAGGILSVYFANRRAKIDLSMHIVREYLNKTGEILKVDSILGDSNNYKFYESTNSDKSSSQYDNYLKIIDTANWYEVVAYLYRKSRLYKKMIDDMRLKETIIVFGRKLSQEQFKYTPDGDNYFCWHDIWKNIHELQKKND